MGYKSMGKDRLLSEKQRTENQTLCLALAQFYSPGQVTCLPHAIHQWEEDSLKQGGTCVPVLPPKLPESTSPRRDPLP